MGEAFCTSFGARKTQEASTWEAALGRSPQEWENIGDIIDKTKGKAVSEHFEHIHSGVEDLRFVLFMRICSRDPEVLKGLES